MRGNYQQQQQYNGTNNHNHNNNKSKFENFMQSQQHTNTNTNNNGMVGSDNNPLSPSNMSHISRMKHNNYAHVIDEMKFNNTNGQQQQHGVGGREREYNRSEEWGFNEPFNTNQQPQQQQQGPPQQQPEYGFQQQYNQRKQNQHYIRQQQQQQNSSQGYNSNQGYQQRGQSQSQQQYSMNNYNQPNNSRQPFQQQQQYEMQNHSNYNTNNTQQSTNTTQQQQRGRAGRNKLYTDQQSRIRSRSTVRKVAERTQSLANAYTLSKESTFSSHGDDVSECGSVFSNISGFNHTNSYFERGGSGSFNSGGGREGGLSGYLERGAAYNAQRETEGGGGYPTQQQQQQQYPPSRQSSSNSGGRRSLDSFVNQRSSQSNNSRVRDGGREDDNVSVTSNTSNTNSVAARRRRAARHSLGSSNTSQQQRTNSTAGRNSLGSTQPSSVRIPAPSSNNNNNNSARSRMRQRMQQRTTAKQQQQQIEEVNIVIPSEINGLDVNDFAFDSGSVGSSRSRGSFGKNSPGNNSLNNNNSAIRLMKRSGTNGSSGRTSPQITVSTKSMTIDTPKGAPSTNVALTSPQSSSSNSNNAQQHTISPVISVEQYSESSSLTCDDVGSNHSFNKTHNAQQQQQQQQGNIFKDAEKMGSTFHKSKKIIRPGGESSYNSIPEEHGTSQPTTAARQQGKGEEDSPTTTTTVRKSRIVYQSSAAIAKQSSSSKNESSSSTTNSVSNSPFRQKDMVSRRLPPSSAVMPSPPSSGQQQNDNPFAVKLRKTKPPIPPSSSSNTGVVSSSFKKDATDLNSIQQTNVTEEDVEGASSSTTSQHPFLGQIKLRKTSTPERVMSGAVVDDAEASKEEVIDVEEEEVVVNPPPQKKKLTYREQQELLRQQQQEEENDNECDEQPPTKDVATLIRERIATNKSNSLARLSTSASSSSAPSNTSSGGSGSTSWRDNLKKTSHSSDFASPTSSSSVAPGVILKAVPSPASIDRSSSTSNDAKSALNAMLLKQRGGGEQQTLQEGKNDDEEKDPRGALMAMLNKRANNFESSVAPRAAKKVDDDGDNDEQQANPRNALSAMLGGAPPPSPSGEGRPSLKNDPKYEKYFKMLKVGMPMPAVQHAMTRDGLDASVMDGDHNLPAPLPEEEQQGVPLKNDPAYAKYFKMLKLGLPMGAVKNAMERDGVDSSVMDGNHNLPANSSSNNGTASSSTTSRKQQRQKDTHRRTRLHWETLEDTKVNSNSVWAMVEEDAEIDKIEIDEKEFTNLFQAELKLTNGAGAPGGGGNTSSNKNVVQVIDPKRANNGGIILARLRISYDDMAQAVDRIDETVMTANQAQGIIEYMPTLAERKSLRDYMKASKNGESAAKNFERLCECEKFMVAMMTVKQSKRKLRALLFKLQFRGCIHDLAKDVYCIEKACDELLNSVRLRKLFGIVLNIGNRLNTAGNTQKRKAGAFSIKSLLKLNQAKAFDNKTTFLHYVVLVVQRNSEELLDFKEDLPTVSKADKIYWDQCVGELEEVETQLENVRKLSLHEAKANKVVYQLPNKSKSTDMDNDSDDLSVESMSLEDEVSLLRSTKIGMFALSAIRKVSQLRERVDTAKEKFDSLKEYFGESDDSKIQPHEMFEIITTFCRSFDAARADVEKNEKVKKRGEKKDNKEIDKGTPRNEKLKAIQENHPVKKKTSPSFPRASSHQPNMGNVLADMQRSSARFGGSPPKVTSRYPDDESSSNNNSPSNASADARAKAIAAEEERAKQLAEAERHERERIEQERILAEQAAEAKWREQEERLEQERVAAEAEARRLQTEQEQRRREEEAARQSRQQNQQVVEDVNPVRSHESEVDGPTGRGRETMKPSQRQSRREIMSARRERARSRHFRNSNSSPTKSAAQSPTPQASQAPPPQASPPPTEETKQETKPKVSASNASARASARDRYARHKKMMHQQRSDVSKDAKQSSRTFQC